MKEIDLRRQIKMEMDRRRITIPAMARRIGSHQGTLYDFFTGRKQLTAGYLQSVLNELHAQVIFPQD